MRSSLPLWRKALAGESDLVEVYRQSATRVLSWAGDEDRDWVRNQLNSVMQSHPLVPEDRSVSAASKGQVGQHDG